MNGYRYSVRIIAPGGLPFWNAGPFTVVVLHEPPPDSIGYRRHTVLRVTGIASHHAAEVIAAVFRAQFGIAEVPK